MAKQMLAYPAGAMRNDMRVICYHRGQMAHHAPRLGMFARGLARHGIKVEYEDGQDCDLAVVWGHKHPIIKRQRERGADYLVMEHGFIGDVVNDWWSLGFNGLNGRADFVNDNVSGDRFEKHLSGFVRGYWAFEPNGYALLMGQVPGDAALRGFNIVAWYGAVRKHHRGPPLVFRPHPLASEAPRLGVPVIGGTLWKALDGAAYVIVYSSTSGVDAICQGVPVIAMDEGSMVWPIAGHKLGEPPPTPDIIEWCHKIAYSQWTPDEIERGDAWDHLRQRYETSAAHESDGRADRVARHTR